MSGLENDGIVRLVRASIAPARERAPGRDLWPAVLGRIHERRRVSRADVVLVTAMILAVPVFPRAFLFLIYAI